MKDAFDPWWEWAEKPVDSMLTIPAELHDAVMALSPDDRRDRAKVNEAVRQYREARGPDSPD
jgi:alkanesulfonate monooxygenase SsuD/methylene tetrahydromethanopterin reductase-like flavin-dependent oxidoreductase (luciferase family)